MIKYIVILLNAIIHYLARHHRILHCSCSNCRYGAAPTILELSKADSCPWYPTCDHGLECDAIYAIGHAPTMEPECYNEEDDFGEPQPLSLMEFRKGIFDLIHKFCGSNDVKLEPGDAIFDSTMKLFDDVETEYYKI